MGGITKTFETSQGPVVLHRPDYDTMREVADSVIPLVQTKNPLELFKSDVARKLLERSVTENTKAALEAVLKQGDFVEFAELWQGYVEHCKFEALFIFPLEQERTKQRREQANELAMTFAAMVEQGVVSKDEVRDLMSETSSSLRASTSDSPPGTAGPTTTSEDKTSG